MKIGKRERLGGKKETFFQLFILKYRAKWNNKAEEVEASSCGSEKIKQLFFRAPKFLG